MNVAPARLTAYEILWRVETEGAYASNLLASARYDQLSSPDHALAQGLTLGVLRWQAQLDFLIEHYARRKLSKLNLEVVIALRLGLYQLNYLDRIPPHAAINESVNLVKLHKKHSAAPMVNAVLRSAQRAGKDETQRLIASLSDDLEKLRLETSHPKWLLQRWINRFGREAAQALASANNQPPNIAFRFNEQVQSAAITCEWLDAHGIKARASALTPNAMVIEAGSLSAQSEPVQKSWIYLQDEASQLVAHLLASDKPTTDNRLLDLCAAPGSKTSLLAQLLPEDALIVAGDLHLSRLQTMRELTSRAGVANIAFVQVDATQPLPFADEAKFDYVLLDAPCSGLGTLQRHPEIKWRLTEAKINELAQLQRRLLENAAAQVRDGGYLTYSVCSTEAEEGEEIITQFCARHPAFRDITRERLAAVGLDPELFLISTFGARTFTHQQGCESFFVCNLMKTA